MLEYSTLGKEAADPFSNTPYSFYMSVDEERAFATVHALTIPSRLAWPARDRSGRYNAWYGDERGARRGMSLFN